MDYYIETGFVGIDEILIGFEPKTLCVVAGHFGCGKSSFVKSIAVNVALKHEVLYVCLEQSKDMLGQRLLSGASGIDSTLIGEGTLTSDQWDALRKARDELSTLKLEVLDSVSSLNSIKMVLESTAKPPKLLIVDYFQLLITNFSNINEEITQLVRGLRELAARFNIAVLAVSSTHCDPESWESDVFQIYDVDPSEAIMNDSDVVMLLHRKELFVPTLSNKGLVDVSIVKHRNGPTGTAKLLFEPKFSQFSSLNKNLDN